MIKEQDVTSEPLIRDFAEPPARYRGKPFWAWNGRLESEELRQVPEYRGVAVRVLVNGTSAGVIAWPPNEMEKDI